MIFILETPINVHPSNGEVYHDNDTFEFQFTGDKISVIQGHLYEIDNFREIMGWNCVHNINSFNQTLVTTHPNISNHCTKGRDYKYNYYIYQKNPQIDTNTITGVFNFDSRKHINRGTVNNRILYLDSSLFEGLNVKKYADGLTGATITLSKKNASNNATFSTVYGYISQNPKKDFSDKDKYNFIYMANPNNYGSGADNTLSLSQFDTYKIQLNPYAPLCDVYIGSGMIQNGSQSLSPDKPDATDIYAPIRNVLNNIRSQITITFDKHEYVIGAMYIDIGGVRRKILNYEEKYISEEENGSVIRLHYDGYFSKEHLDKYKNSNGDVPFKIYCNYIKTPWYDFKYRSVPKIDMLQTNLNPSGLNCRASYSQLENVSLKSYDYEVYTNNEKIEIDATEEQPIEIQSLPHGKTSIKLPYTLNQYDSLTNCLIVLYSNGVSLSKGAFPIEVYDKSTNTIIIGMYLDETITSITKVVIILNKKYLYSSGVKYSYNLTHNFQIPTATSNYLIRNKITTQENDIVWSDTIFYCNPDKVSDEYIVEYEDDIRNLPTTTEPGKAQWSDEMPYSSLGSLALVIETGNVYILGTDGWHLCSEYTPKKE